MDGCDFHRQGTTEPCRHLSRQEAVILVVDQVNDLCEGVLAECILQRDQILDIVLRV